MMQISLTIPGEPTAKGRHRAFKDRAGNVRSYTPEKTRAAESDIRAIVRGALGEMPHFTGPVEITAVFYFETPRSWSARKRAAVECQLRPLKPDGDNAEKLLIDALCGLIYQDDKQVVICRWEKRYSMNPRTDVTIASLS